MKYTDFLQKTSFTHQEILGFSYGTAIEDGPEDLLRLPAPPMLMIDRVVELCRDANHRLIIGEQDIRQDHWFFHSHFLKDPVQPGCLGLDAIWQLLGFYCLANGAEGVGRALGCKEVSFFGQIRPANKLVRYEVTVRRYQQIPSSQTAMVIGSAKVFVDGEHVYDITDAKVGTFRNIRYANYPFPGPNAIGGKAV